MEFLKESVDYAIFFILGLMGFVSIWLTIERVSAILQTRCLSDIQIFPASSRKNTPDFLVTQTVPNLDES